MSAAKKATAGRPWPVWKAILIALPMFLLTALMLMPQIMTGPDLLKAIAMGIVFLLYNALFFLMAYTGRTHIYRSAFFTFAAVAFVLFFITNLLETRGSMVLTQADVIAGETPFCHLVIPTIILPAILTRTIVFPGSLLRGFASIAGMIVFWIGASLATGRGFCSWACFYGGLDEGFSRLLKKPVIKKVDARWTYLPWAVLIGVVLLSAITLSPAYCEWLCPFKAVTEFFEPNSLVAVIQLVIFIALFIGLVIVLPLLTKRRIQCGLFCPFGAMQALTNKINVFDVRIDREKCVDCDLCARACPTFSLDEGSIRQGRALITCTKCGKCVDACPKGAIYFHVKGTALPASESQRLLFLYPAFLFGAALTIGMSSYAVWRLLKLITTGSIL